MMSTARRYFPLVLFSLLYSMVSHQVFAALETPLPKVETYDQLVHEIRVARDTSRRRVEQAVEAENVREAWEIGKLIDEHVLQHKERADYGRQVIIKLAKDLETSETELKYMLEFARAYPIRRPAGELSWSHYQALLSLNDQKEREAVTEEAVRRHWSRNRVREEVRRRQAARKPAPENAPAPVLTAAPGRVGVYRVIRAKVGPFTGELAVDLGFASYFQPKEIRKFKEKDLVILERRKLKLFKGSNEDRYTYRAYVSQIVDGDTFKAVMDLGFEFVTEQKLRLRGLDAPEIESAEGREAKAFLEEQITKAGGTVVIKTVKSDKYDRYLADVFVPRFPAAQSPEDFDYLNNQLLEAGLALRVEES